MAGDSQVESTRVTPALNLDGLDPIVQVARYLGYSYDQSHILTI